MIESILYRVIFGRKYMKKNRNNLNF